jgi:flagellar M-ring protein FliF
MPAALAGGFARLKSTIAGFSLAQRTLALIGVAVLVLGIVALSTWAAKPSYTPLFSGLSASDASTIVEQLRSSNIPYELTNGGSTVLVPEESVYEQRLTAAAAGLPSSSTGGYSLLDTMGVTTSEFQQSVTYKRALEGELAKTISAMKGVNVASVQLAIPEESVFVSEKQSPTASVFVQTDNGVTLNTDQVNAIVHLTSASIEGMDATGVAVIDANGTVLSAVGTGTTGSSDSQATDYEQRVRTTVQAMLDRIVGAGNSTVAVAATISSESADVVSETFAATPDVPALSETSDTESFTGSGDAAAGVLGAETAAAANGTDASGNYTSESATKNNAVNKVTESRSIPAGAIARQTISVAINTDAADDIDQIQVENLVAAAAGVQTERGDSVAVRLVGFNAGASDDAAAALLAAQNAADADRWAELAKTGIIALAIVVPILVGLTMLLRRSRRKVGSVLDTTEVVGDATEILPMMFTPGGSGSGAARDAAIAAGLARPSAQALHRGDPQSGFMGDGVSTATAVLPTPGSLEPSAADIRNAEISNFAASDPKKTAEYLRRLMDERRS